MSDKSLEANEELQNDIRRQQASARGVLWLNYQSLDKCWSLSNQDMSVLLGGVSVSTWRRWKKKAEEEIQFKLNQDTLRRVSLLYEIHESLSISSPPGYVYDFFKRPINHALFEGRSAKEHLLKYSEIDDMIAVRNYFQSKCF